MIETIALGMAFFSVVVLFWTLSKIYSLKNTLSEVKSKLDVISAPAETLTHITSSLQTNMSMLSQSVTEVTRTIGDIETQATKIETLGKKYEETEGLTRRIYNIMIGSYEKGRSGENYLRNMMNNLLKIGMVRENVSIGTKVVEYAVVFDDRKLLAIDSKVVATKDVEALFDENTSDDERKILRKKIRVSLSKKVSEICQYIDPQTTLPCAVMAIPDSLVELSSEIVPEAVRKNVLLAGYSAVPQLIVYFVKIHGFYSIEEDVEQMKSRLLSIQQKISKLDDKFFSNRFDKPVKMLTNATLQVQRTLDSVRNTLALDSEDLPELSCETED